MNGVSELVLPTNPTEFWTVVIAVGTWVLVIGALRSLSSLKLTKQDMDDRKSRREKETAIKQTEHFVNVIIPTSEDFAQGYRSRGIDTFARWKAVRLGNNEKEHFEEAIAWLAHLTPELRRKSAELVNALEAWSSPITAGLADEELAFLGCGMTYCRLVHQVLPLLIFVRVQHGAMHATPSLNGLYTRWSSRVIEEDLEEPRHGFWSRVPPPPTA
jgi:hypothetical protein